MDRLTCLKYARIAVDIVFLLADLWGITLPVSGKSHAIQQACKFLWMNPAARLAIKTFLLAWKNAHNEWESIKALVNLVRDLQACGLTWMIFTSLLHGMSMWNWFMSAGQISLSFSAMFATGGWALGAKILGALLSAKSLIDLIKSL